MKNKKVIEIAETAPKSWWAGDVRVEPFMSEILAALDRRSIEGEVRVDIYNRCYEAVYRAIQQYAPRTNKSEG